MRELKTDHKVVSRAVTLGVCLSQRLDQPGYTGLVVIGYDQLVRVCPAIGPDRHGFAAEDQLGPAFTKPLPAPLHFLGHSTGGRAVPAFHRVDRNTIPRSYAVKLDTIQRSSQGRFPCEKYRIVAGQIDAKFGNMIPKRLRCF